MHARRSFARIPIAVLVAALLGACGHTVIVVPRTAPAEVNLAGYKRIAVAGVLGEGGEQLATALNEAIFATGRFEVLERKNVEQIMAEQELSISGLVNSDTAVPIGEMLASATLVVGEVTVSDYQENVQREVKTCLTKEKKPTEYPCTHFTRTANATLSAALKVLDTTSGKILAIKTLTTSAGDRRKAIDNEPPPFNSRDAWLARCRQQLAADFAKVIAPYQVQVSVVLLSDDDFPELEQGVNFARLGNWDQALARFGEALARAEGDPEVDAEAKAMIHYNLGIGYGYSGRYAEGIRALELAYSLDPEPRYLQQVATVKQFQEDDAKLAAQKAGDFDAALAE